MGVNKSHVCKQRREEMAGAVSQYHCQPLNGLFGAYTHTHTHMCIAGSVNRVYIYIYTETTNAHTSRLVHNASTSKHVQCLLHIMNTTQLEITRQTCRLLRLLGVNDNTHKGADTHYRPQTRRSPPRAGGISAGQGGERPRPLRH